MKRTRLLFTLALIPLDLILLTAAFIAAFQLRNAYAIFPNDAWTDLAARLHYVPITAPGDYTGYIRYLRLVIPSVMVIAAMAGLYRIPMYARWWERLARIFVAITVGMFFILFLFFLRKDFFLPRSILIYSWLLSVAAVFVGHSLVRLVQALLFRADILTTRLAVIGENQTARSLIRQMTGSPYAAYSLAWQGPADSGTAAMEKLFQSGTVDQLIVVEDRGQEHLAALRDICLEYQVAFMYVPILFTQLPSSYAVQYVDETPMIEVKPSPLDGWGQVNKRLFDMVISLATIIVTSPLFLLVSLGILLTSPGPLLYRHRRIGRNRRAIYTWKFRTMRPQYCDTINPRAKELFEKYLDGHPAQKAEWEENHKLKDDPRVYGFGAFLRKTSLDELPQLFNVLGGSLSLVGPRPIVQDEVSKYGERAKFLFSIKPGLTGLWQVSGRSDVSYEDRVRLDMSYINHWNLWWDIRILIKTAWVLAFKRGAGGAY